MALISFLLIFQLLLSWLALTAESRTINGEEHRSRLHRRSPEADPEADPDPDPSASPDPDPEADPKADAEADPDKPSYDNSISSFSAPIAAVGASYNSVGVQGIRIIENGT